MTAKSKSVVEQIEAASFFIYKIHNDALSKEGISPTYIKYLYIIKEDKYISPSKLANHFNVSRATVTLQLQKIQRLGYINILPSNIDLKQKSLVLTAKGEDAVKKHREIINFLDEYLIREFNSENIKAIEDLALKMEKVSSRYFSSYEKRKKN